MGAALIKQLVARKLDGGTIGRYQAMIRKVDSALGYQGRRGSAQIVLPKRIRLTNSYPLLAKLSGAAHAFMGRSQPKLFD